MNQALTKETLQTALTAANVAYVAREKNPNVNKAGINPDIAKGARIVAGMSDATFAGIVGLCGDVDLCSAVAGMTNTKKPMRTVQFLSFIVSGDVKDLRGSAKTALLEFCAMLNGASNRESLCFAATGATREGQGEGVNLRDSTLARKLRTLAGTVKLSTEQTQNSVAFSKNGIGETLGISRKETSKSHPTLNSESPILRALVARINATAESTLIEIAAASEEKKSRKGKGSK